ncbi:MAG: ABC transporter permease [Anaerolineaceae bacterium]|nr:ABC transporter permease [Anaerolineae bacterium]MCB9459750.1 ABC transporter permease [Anaerolineaceae bacterium]
MMRQLMRIRAIFVVAIRRLLAQPLLSGVTLLGVTIAVALILTIPIYSESVAFRLLNQRLTERDDQGSRPAFSYMFSYIGSWNDPVNWEATTDLDTYLRQKGGDLGLNVTLFVRHLETLNLRMFPGNESNYRDERRMLDYVTFGLTEHIEDYIEFVEGGPPAPADPAPDSIIEVMIYDEFASEFGIQVGETYLGYNWRLDPGDPLQITQIRVSGIWHEIDPSDEFWFYKPTVFGDILLVHQDTFVNRISAYSEQDINLGVWYLVTDGSSVNTSRVDDLIERQDNVEKIADQLLPGTFIQSSPVDELGPYARTVSFLTLTLTVFSIPIIVLLVLFLMMILGLVVDRQRNETAVLRSRGTPTYQVIGLAMVEGIVISTLALIIGFFLASAFTRIMSSTRSFMDFSGQTGLIVSFPPNLIQTAIIALVFTVLLRVIPTVGAARQTIISYKQSNSRAISRPLWQRLGVDILLLLLIGYFYYQVDRQGSLIQVENGIANIEQAYDQPFVFLMPPLTIFALTLFMLRFLPLIPRLIGWLLQFTDNVGLLIVTRQLERSASSYYLPLILLVSTIGLGIYTASFARTIDRYLYEQQFYRTAGDISVRVFSEAIQGDDAIVADDANVVYMHISEINSIENIESATRIGEYRASARLTSGNVTGQFIGIDRAEFGEVAFWRSDFADTRLGYLLNALAPEQDTVLVSREFMQARGLNVGDFIQVDITSYGENIPMNLQIVGALDYFPRWYPVEEGPLFVGNLDYIFELAQTELPYRIIARVTDDFNQRDFEREVRSRGATGVFVDEPLTRILREQDRPERQGLFGLLSIGFIASSLATTIGFLLYTIFSYQRRYVEFGILRAIGLPRNSMTLAVTWELGILIILGVSFGVGIGLLVSALYIPYMQFVSNLEGIVPPYMVTFAWSEIAQITALFVVTFLIVMLILLVTLRRMRIFQAVKLGETI